MSITKAESARRLLVLADFLEKLPPYLFNYCTWVRARSKELAPDKLVAQDGTVSAPEGFCGTTACALGWAATIPEFKKLGLCIEAHAIDGGSPHFYIVLDHADYDEPIADEDEIAEQFFGLDEYEAGFMFYPGGFYKPGILRSYGDEDYDSEYDAHKQDPDRHGPPAYATATEVAAHIRRFVKNYRS